MRRLLLVAALGTSAMGQTSSAQLASVEKQWASVRTQWESVERHRSLTLPRPAEPVPAGSVPAGSGPLAFRAPQLCDPLPSSRLEPMIRGAAGRHGIHPALVTAVVRQESGGSPCAVSPKGALGLMQLMPATAASLGIGDPFEPGENLEGGVRFLKGLLDRYQGDFALALGAYNAGPGRVDQAGGVPAIAETKAYVRNVLRSAGLAAISLETPEMP